MWYSEHASEGSCLKPLRLCSGLATCDAGTCSLASCATANRNPDVGSTAAHVIRVLNAPHRARARDMLSGPSRACSQRLLPHSTIDFCRCKAAALAAASTPPRPACCASESAAPRPGRCAATTRCSPAAHAQTRACCRAPCVTVILSSAKVLCRNTLQARAPM